MSIETPSAIPAVSRTLTTLTDGTVRLKVDFEPYHRETAMRLFGEPGTPIVLACLTLEAEQAHLQKNFLRATKLKGDYGEQAKILKLSGFFRTPNVWKAIGSDGDFLTWLRQQSCAFCHTKPTEHQAIEAAHVRRVAHGAGIAIKPEYSAIPLCHEHHALQHQQGESVLGGKAWCDKKRIECLSRWAWGNLKAKLGYESWSQVPPQKLIEWATLHQLINYVPHAYQERPFSDE